MKLTARPELARAYKEALSLPDPDRYPISVTELLWCEGKAAMKEWPDYAPPFNAKLSRGLQAEYGMRKGAAMVFNLKSDPLRRTRDGITGNIDDAAFDVEGDRVVEYKSTDWRGDHEIRRYWFDQNMSYAKLFGLARGRFVILYNMWNDGMGDIVIVDVEYTEAEIERNWQRLLDRKPRIEAVREWAKGGGPRELPAHFRRPQEPEWECYSVWKNGTVHANCSLYRDKLCPGARSA